MSIGVGKEDNEFRKEKLGLKNDLCGFNLTCNQRSLPDCRHRSYDHLCITDRSMLNHTRIFESGTHIFSSKL
jgi:hypothetical protein